MKDKAKTKEQLGAELAQMRQRIAELEAAETARQQAEAALRESEQQYRTLFADSQRQAQELALLHKVRAALASELDLSVLFRTVIEAIADTFGYTLVSLYMLQEDTLVLQHQIGYDQLIERIPITRGIIGRVTRTGEPVLLKDIHTNATFLEAIEEIVSEVCVPLFDQGRVVGVLNVESSKGMTLDEADLQVMTALSEHVNVAIGRARLYAEVQESKDLYNERRMYLEAVLGAAPDAIVTLDAHHRIVEWSPGAERLFGYSRPEAIGQNLDHLITNPDTLEEAVGLTQIVMSGKDVPPAEIVRYRKDGSPVNVIAAGSPILAGDELIGIVAVYADITERKRAEEALRESEEKYSSLINDAVNSLSSGIFILDRDFKIVWINRAMEEFFGIEKDTIIGCDKRKAIQERIKHVFEDPERFERTVLGTYDDNSYVESFECHVLPLGDRKERLLLHWSMPIRTGTFAGGRIEHYYDITERKRAEDLVRIQRDLAVVLSSTSDLTEGLNRLLETAFQMEGIDCGGVYRADGLNGKVDLVAYKGLPPEFTKSASHYDANAPHARLIMAGKPIYRPYPKILSGAKDEVRWSEGLRATAIVPVQHEGRIIAAINLASHTHDEFPPSTRNVIETIAAQIGGVIARARAEEALRESQKNLQTLFDTLDDFVFILDTDGRILHFNPVVERRLGYSAQKLAEMNVLQMHPPERREEAAEIVADLLTGKRTSCPIPLMTKDGSLIPVETKVSQGQWGNRDGVFSISRDITARQRTEEALRQRNRELTMLNRVGRTLGSTLDLDQILATALEDVRRLLDVVACSVWLKDAQGDLVCRQVIGPQSDIVRGWRLAPGKGLAGRVALSGESLIVPDVRADERYFEAVDQQTGLGLRSILSLPLRIKQNVIGVIQVVDTEIGRFSPADVTLLEPLAMSAAAAIENARLYEQAQRDAETKATLLREVNHRVKNSLTAVMGMLALEMQRPHRESADLQAILRDLQDRIRGLTSVHDLLSAAQWSPLPLDRLVTEVIQAALNSSPIRHKIKVSVRPAAEPLSIMPHQATGLALVVNELTTNSIKHVFSDRSQGHIDVQITAGQDDRDVTLRFHDDGPGWPDDVLRGTRENVGLNIIRMTVRSPLRGQLALSNDGGAVATITFRLAQTDL